MVVCISFARVSRARSVGACLGVRARLQRHAKSQCESYSTEVEKPLERLRVAVAGTSGCSDGGVRFYAARSWKAEESGTCFAIAEKLHQFAVVDGVGVDGLSSARVSAGRLSRYVSQSFVERVHQVPLETATDPISGLPIKMDEAAASAWGDALATGFSDCDREAIQDAAGSCGAMFCVVARSGVYVASVGTGRAVIGTEEDGGLSVLIDEASNPHCKNNATEVNRFGAADENLLPDGPTRLLGGGDAKRKEPRIIALPDVVRHRHAPGRRYVLLGSPGVWAQGPEAAVHWAVQAYRRGESPANAVIARSEGDAVVLVVVLPRGLGSEGSPLPPHGQLVHSPSS